MTQDPGARGPSRPCMPNHFQPREEGGIFPQPNQPRKENKVSSLPCVVCPGSKTKKIHQKKKTNCLGSSPSVRGVVHCCVSSCPHKTQENHLYLLQPPYAAKMQIATIPPRVPAVVRPKKDYRLAVPRVCCPKKPRKINARLLKTSDKGK